MGFTEEWMEYLLSNSS